MDFIWSLFRRSSPKTLEELERQHEKLMIKLKKNQEKIKKNNDKCTSRSDWKRRAAQKQSEHLYTERGNIMIRLDSVRRQIVAEKIGNSPAGSHTSIKASYGSLTSVFSRLSSLSLSTEDTLTPSTSRPALSFGEDVKLASSLLLVAKNENDDFTLL